MHTLHVTEDEMNVRQAAAVLGVSKFRVHALIGQGQLEAEKRESDVGTPYYVLKKAAVEALAEDRRKRATGELPLRGTRPKLPPEKKTDGD